MFKRFNNKLYDIICEGVNDQLEQVVSEVQDSLDVVVKNNQFFVTGTYSDINNSVNKIEQIIKNVNKEYDNNESEVLLFNPQIVEFDKKYLHSKTRDEGTLPADLNQLGDNIDIEGKWSSLRDQDGRIILRGTGKEIMDILKDKFDKDYIYMLVFATMIGAKNNTIIAQ